jgi:hypothetical protein
MRRLGGYSTFGIIVAILTLIIIIGVGYARDGVLYSPGALNAQQGDLLGGVRSHAEITQCSACHAAYWSNQKMADLCLVCHTDLEQDPKNFHKTLLTESQLRECYTCHTDHNGIDAPLTRANLTNFPHNQFGFSLNTHQKMADGSLFACTDCHDPKLSKMNLVVCEICHLQINATFMQPHIDTFGQKCLDCHDGLDTYGKKFNHNKVSFSLQGKHALVNCTGCHPNAHTIADLKSTGQKCADCHTKDDPHGSRFGMNCAQCHTPVDWKQATFDHKLANFQLLGKHAQVACIKCHINNVYLGTPMDCYSCHSKDDTHQGHYGQSCDTCHTSDGWLPANFDHSLSSFPLTGKHTLVICTDCHINNVYIGTPTDCYSCHAKNDAHQGQYGKSCDACHTTDGWTPATFDHSLSIFPLTGAHIGLDCTRCHQNGVFKGTPTQCVACHADPTYHAGLFGTACATCHTTSAWVPAQFHGAHTFPFNHGGAGSCQSCHPSTLRTYTCYGCHGGVHGGGRRFTNCISCHPTGRGGD